MQGKTGKETVVGSQKSVEQTGPLLFTTPFVLLPTPES